MLFSAYFCVLFKPNPLSKACGFMIWLHFMVPPLIAWLAAKVVLPAGGFLGVTVTHFLVKKITKLAKSVSLGHTI